MKRDRTETLLSTQEKDTLSTHPINRDLELTPIKYDGDFLAGIPDILWKLLLVLAAAYFVWIML